MRRLQVAPQADKDISESAGYIALNDPQAAVRFLNSIEKECENLCLHPEIGSTRYGEIFPEIGLVRFLPVGDFCNWLIFYVIQPEAILVIRVINGKRSIPDLFS